MMRSRNLRLFLCLLLAAATVVLGALSVRRKVEAFQPLGFTGQRAGALVRVSRIDNPSTGLVPGDEILLVDGAEATGPDVLSQRLRQRATAELAVLRAGQVVRVTFHRPPLALDIPYLILVLIGSAYLLIGLFTLLRQRSGESFVFCLWCLTSALLYLLTPVPPVDGEYRLAYFGDQLARSILPALTLHLFLIFPALSRPAAAGSSRSAAPGGARGSAWLGGLRELREPSPLLIALLYLPGAVLLTLQLDLMLTNGRWLFAGHPTAGALQALDRLDLLHLVSFSLAAVAVLIYRALRERGWEPRRQMHWMIFGLAGGYLPFLVFYVAPFVLGLRPPQLLAAVAVLPLALVPLTFAYAILRYKLWDIEVIARDVISATLTLLLGVLGFSLVNLAITRGISPELPLARNLLSFAAGLGIAGLLVPTRHTLSAAIERLQYRGTFGKRRALLGLGRDLLHERDLGRLCSALLDRLAAGMDLERAGIYLAQGDNLVVIAAIDAIVAIDTLDASGASGARGGAGAAGTSPRDAARETRASQAAHPHPFHRAPSSAGVRAAYRRTMAAPPLVLPSASLDPSIWRENFYRLGGTELPAGAPSPLQQLFIAGYRYAFPLIVRGRGVGLVLAGWKRDQAPLNSDDLDLIRHLLNQAALAIENAQLLGQLHLQLQEVQRLQRFSDGIFESSPAGIAVLDSELRLVSANPAFAALVGREPRQLLGKAIEEVLPVSALPSPGEGPIEVSFTDRGPAGDDGADTRERFLQLSLAEVTTLAEASPSAGGRDAREPLRILVAYDVSERVAMERSLKEKDRLAALGMLAAGVAHEVNTPITGISSYAQMLLSDTAENDPRYSLLKKVERQTFRAARIVNNLLEFAHERQRERQPVALLPLLRECVELLGDRLERGHVALDWDLPPAADAILVLGADGELEQVFTNLLGNALDAMSGQPGGRLGIAVASANGQVNIRVQDSGPGIPPEQLATVFQPFYSTKLHRGGTGLGLTISHDIVQRHGGTLAVESTPGHGACFTVELPRFAPAPAIDAARDAAAAGPAAPAAPTAPTAPTSDGDPS
jgi:two-component system, NtrC family, sensor kinase